MGKEIILEALDNNYVSAYRLIFDYYKELEYFDKFSFKDALSKIGKELGRELNYYTLYRHLSRSRKTTKKINVEKLVPKPINIRENLPQQTTSSSITKTDEEILAYEKLPETEWDLNESERDRIAELVFLRSQERAKVQASQNTRKFDI